MHSYILLYTNDLPIELLLPCLIFADDVAILGSRTKAKVATGLSRVLTWASTWDMRIKANKSHLLIENSGVTVAPEGPVFAATSE